MPVGVFWKGFCTFRLIDLTKLEKNLHIKVCWRIIFVRNFNRSFFLFIFACSVLGTAWLHEEMEVSFHNPNYDYKY